MLSNSLLALSFTSLVFTSFGCAAVQSSHAPATPATAIEQVSTDQAVAGYVSPVESSPEAAEIAAPSAPAAEGAGASSRVSEPSAAQGASLRGSFLRGEHKAGALAGASGKVGLEGAIPPDAVQRIMRQGLGQAERCYENGLRRDPSLAGRVTVVLTIGATGKVWLVRADKDSEIRDPHVVSCIESSFYMLSFPAHDASVVKVIYPLVLGARS